MRRLPSDLDLSPYGTSCRFKARAVVLLHEPSSRSHLSAPLLTTDDRLLRRCRLETATTPVVAGGDTQRSSHSCSSLSTSARSCRRPDAFLLRIRSFLERTTAGWSNRRASTRLAHASSNSTPSIAVRMSIRNGSTPIWNTMPGVTRSFSVRSPKGAPNAAIAARALQRFPRRA